MNRKWWRYAIIGILLFDVCLIVVGADRVPNVGVLTISWVEGLALQNTAVAACLKAHVMENLTVAGAILLMVSLL